MTTTSTQVLKKPLSPTEAGLMDRQTDRQTQGEKILVCLLNKVSHKTNINHGVTKLAQNRKHKIDILLI